MYVGAIHLGKKSEEDKSGLEAPCTLGNIEAKEWMWNLDLDI